MSDHAPNRPATAQTKTSDLVDPQRARLTAWFIVMLLLVTTFAAALRLYKLGEPGFWEDELFTLRDVADLKGKAINAPAKVLGYVPTAIGLWANGVDITAARPDEPTQWRSLGFTEWPSRIGSCVVGILTIPVLVWFSRRLLGWRGAILLGLLIAVAPWHIQWSQSARFYALQMLFYSLCLILYFEGTDRGSIRRLLAAYVCLLLAFMSQPPAILIVAVFAADWLVALIRRHPVRLGWSGWISGIVVVAICMGLFIYGTTGGRARDWERFARSDGHKPLILVMGTAYLLYAPLVAFALTCVWMLWRQRRTRLGWYLLLAIVAPLACLIGLYFKQYVHTRYAFIVLYPCAALAALGLDEIYEAVRPRVGRLAGWSAALFVILALLLVDYAYFTGGHAWRERWEPAFAYIEKHNTQHWPVASERQMIAQYYLRGETTLVAWPGSAEKLAAIDHPLWLIHRAESATLGKLDQWVEQSTELKAYFDSRIIQPFSSIRVHYYRPAGPEVNDPSSNPAAASR